jgi:hypothetical protein
MTLKDDMLKSLPSPLRFQQKVEAAEVRFHFAVTLKEAAYAMCAGRRSFFLCSFAGGPVFALYGAVSSCPVAQSRLE